MLCYNDTKNFLERNVFPTQKSAYKGFFITIMTGRD
jgi:hypothetical protein